MNDTGVKSTADKIYQAIIIIILCLFALAALLPFLLLVASSLTEESVILREGYNFWPKEWSLYAYDYLFNTNATKVFRSYGITFFITIVGTCLSLLIGPMLGWVLSRRDYKRGKVLTFMVFFTMLFNGGVVPSYIMWTQLFHIRNTIWA
ncbi:MAG: carbohydrate ABC transporter permease, partial [Bacteroidaceae bacterium]|nr:carbohydrate ABC transporter permease [Bacteroidaceae bacterium]